MPTGAELAKDPAMTARRKALADPVRFRIIMLLGDAPGGLTAKEMAERMSKDTNRLYYHLRILESAGLVEAMETRSGGPMPERIYTYVQDQRYTWEAKDPIEMAAVFAAQLEVEREDTERVIFERARALEAEEQAPAAYWGRPPFVTTHDEIEEFSTKLLALVDEFRARGKKLRDGGTPADAMSRGVLYYIVREEPADEADLHGDES